MIQNAKNYKQIVEIMIALNENNLNQIYINKTFL